MLPARIAVVGPHWWGWGVGEFNKPVKISYFWGRDIDMDEQGRAIRRLANKMAAIEIFRNHDYSVLAVSGADNVSLAQKIDTWSREVEVELESLRGWEVI